VSFPFSPALSALKQPTRTDAVHAKRALLPMPQHQSKSGFAAPFVDFELVGGAELVGWGFAFVGVEEDGVDGVAFG
jgi:hypothetical protein